MSRGSPVGLVTELRAGRCAVWFPAEALDVSVGRLNQLFFFQSEHESLFLGMNRLGPTVDHPSPYSGEVKNVWSSTSSPSCAFTAWTGTAVLSQLSLSKKQKYNRRMFIRSRRRPWPQQQITVSSVDPLLLRS